MNKYANTLNMLMQEKQKKLLSIANRVEDDELKKRCIKYSKEYFTKESKKLFKKRNIAYCCMMLKDIYTFIKNNFFCSLKGHGCLYCTYYYPKCNICPYGSIHGICCKYKNSTYNQLIESFAMASMLLSMKIPKNFYKKLIKQIMKKCNITVEELFNEQRK